MVKPKEGNYKCPLSDEIVKDYLDIIKTETTNKKKPCENVEMQKCNFYRSRISSIPGSCIQPLSLYCRDEIQREPRYTKPTPSIKRMKPSNEKCICSNVLEKSDITTRGIAHCLCKKKQNASINRKQASNRNTTVATDCFSSVRRKTCHGIIKGNVSSFTEIPCKIEKDIHAFKFENNFIHPVVQNIPVEGNNNSEILLTREMMSNMQALEISIVSPVFFIFVLISFPLLIITIRAVRKIMNSTAQRPNIRVEEFELENMEENNEGQQQEEMEPVEYFSM